MIAVPHSAAMKRQKLNEIASLILLCYFNNHSLFVLLLTILKHFLTGTFSLTITLRLATVKPKRRNRKSTVEFFTKNRRLRTEAESASFLTKIALRARYVLFYSPSDSN